MKWPLFVVKFTRGAYFPELNQGMAKMLEVVENLSSKKILGNRDIHILREYIRKKYPGADLKERSAILANAVHKVIDGHIREFEERNRAEIRNNLLRRAIRNNNYEISAADVFKVFFVTQKFGENLLNSLVSWINRQQEIPVSRETVSQFFNKIRRGNDNLSDSELELALKSFKKSDQPERRCQKNKLLLVAEKPLASPAKFVVDTVFKGQIYKIKQTLPVAAEAFARVRQWIPELTYRLSPGKRVYHKMLAATLAVSCLVIFQPLKDLIAPSFGWQTGKTRVVNRNPDYPTNPLPEELKYRPVDILKLRNYLLDRNSLLADEPYLTTIIKTAEDFNINPLLLFAITGQEQSFVPRTEINAGKIANNPFNVHNSWYEYNTDIQDSARIAAITIINLSENRPPAVDPISWINRKYSEDINWWVGVRRIFEELRAEVR